MGYYSEVDLNKLYENIEKVYNVVGVDRSIVVKSAELDSALTKRGIFLSPVDLMVAATAMTNNMTLVTAKPELYQGLQKFGLKLLSAEELCDIIKQEIERYAK